MGFQEEMASLCPCPAASVNAPSPFHHPKIYLKEFCVVAVLGEVLSDLILKAFFSAWTLSEYP